MKFLLLSFTTTFIHPSIHASKCAGVRAEETVAMLAPPCAMRVPVRDPQGLPAN